MKLNNHHRDSFIRAVMDDVPEMKMTTSDVQGMYEEAMPPKVRNIFKDETLRKHLRHEGIYAGSMRHYVCTGNLSESEIMKDYHAHIDERNKMRSKLRAMAYGCSTLKQLKEAAPDLTKYMPSETGKVTAGVPMIINVMEDLTKLGFPKAA